MIRSKFIALRDEILFWRHDGLSRKILSGVFTVGALTAGVKAVAFAKELVVAGRFGTSDTMDAFTSAFVIWTFVVGLIAGALPDAVVPVYAKVKKRSASMAESLIISSIWVYFFQLLALIVLLLILGHILVPWFTREYSPEKQELTLQLFRHLAPFCLFWGLSQLMTALLQAKKNFALASSAPALVPAITIAFLIITWHQLGIYSLVYGILAGSFIHLLVLIAGYFRDGSALELFRPRDFWTPDLQLILRTSWPYLLSGVVMGSSVLIDIGMAAWLDPGSVSTLAYAERICAIGLTLAATATTEAFFPYLSDLVASQDWQKLRQTVIRFSKLIFTASLAVVALFWLASEGIVALLFERNEFTPTDTVRVASVLRWLCLQIPFYIIAVLAARVVCAMLASKVIFVTSCVNLLLNISFNSLLIRVMGIEGLALSTAIVYAASSAMLFSYFLVVTNRKADCLTSDR